MHGITGPSRVYIAFIPSPAAPHAPAHGGDHAPSAGSAMKGDVVHHGGGATIKDTSDLLPAVVRDRASGDATRRGGNTGGKRQPQGDESEALRKLLEQLLALLDGLEASKTAPTRLAGDVIVDRDSAQRRDDRGGEATQNGKGLPAGSFATYGPSARGE